MTPSRSALVAAVAALLLAGCGSNATSDDGGGDGDKASGGSGGADCSVFAGLTDPELKLFSSSAIAKGPTEGQTYGDGTELSVTLSPEAIDADLLPQFEVISASESGAPIGITNSAFDPTTGGDGTYSTSTSVFGHDEFVGKAVVVEIFAISTEKVGDAVPYGDKLLLGNFCLTLAKDDS